MNLESSRRNLLLFLLILAFYTGAAMEFSHGSKSIGVLLFIIAFVLTLNIKIKKVSVTQLLIFKHPKLLGSAIIISDIISNYVIMGGLMSELGHLDTMILFLGVFLIISGVNNEQAHKVGVFGTYMSLSFVILYVIFYKLFKWLHINILNYYDHYAIMLPSVYLCRTMGIPIDVVRTETVCIHGVQDITVGIGGPCSGLFSMFLLIGIIIAFVRVQNAKFNRNTLKILIIVILVAYIANLFRISALYVIGYLYGYDTMFFWHTHLGWIIFAGVAMVIMWALDKRSLDTTGRNS